jgi:hypothetical protein
MIMSRDQNAVRNNDIKIYNNSFERVEQLKYLGKKLIQKENIFRNKLRAD